MSLLAGLPKVDGKTVFSVVLVFPCGKIQAECGCKWGLLKVRERKYKGSMVGCRWSPLAELVCLCFSSAFKTYTNPQQGRPRRFPPNDE
jgi:hypothetical protein